ncbi:MAG: cbb3-type cytochrome c oxidase subunit I [Candidatus Dadabacteria bacterium]|nr:cbb3-type cytochrome c oxidase subunit I [Candidatus Dadabacteria bacterium]
MIELARRFIKTGLVFLMVGLVLGLYLIASKHLLGSWPDRGLITAHVHVLLVGFLLSLIMGVAIWMFPRLREDGSYSPALAEATYWLLTLGTAFRFAAEVAIAYLHTMKALDWVVVLGAASQTLAAILFVYNIWSRVRPMGKQT